MNGKQITASLATLYMFTNQLRAVVYWNGLHPYQFFGIEMTTYDSYFIMPLVFGIVNYGLLKTSQLKSLQTIQNDKNRFKLINICFMSSLAVVGLPIDILMIYSIMGCCQTLIQYKKQKEIENLLRNSQQYLVIWHLL
ncbi:unnamed protein product [Paramecium pentaurelia]|uniref:Uncharacterized protein n=1 Tax=Paramecium pentaurelia TaxID=43138 RepID=A0A8S1TE17_9CILI|nr:unnamed protein product [Paramecium pentaurelia]